VDLRTDQLGITRYRTARELADDSDARRGSTLLGRVFGLIPILVTRGAKTLQGTHTYELSTDASDIHGPEFKSRLEWSSVDNCIASPLGILLMSGKLALLALPGRVLNAASRAELLALARTKGLKVKSIR
jgi:hypothetical protein